MPPRTRSLKVVTGPVATPHNRPVNDWSTWCKDFCTHLAAAGRSDGTIKLRRYHLSRAAECAPTPGLMTTEDIETFLANPAWNANTRRTYQVTLRQFFAWARATGRRDDDPTEPLLTITGTPGRPRPCPERELRLAVIAADDRARLMLSLGASAGCRRAEIATCRGDRVREDVDGYTLIVHGKGGKIREVPIDDDLAEKILARGPGWTFPGQMRADGVPVRGDRNAGHLSPRRVGEIVSAVLPGKWTTHTLRHRFASAAYAEDRDIRAVQELLGHASVATTQIYTAIPNGAKRRAAAAAAFWAA